MERHRSQNPKIKCITLLYILLTILLATNNLIWDFVEPLLSPSTTLLFGHKWACIYRMLISSMHIIVFDLAQYLKFLCNCFVICSHYNPSIKTQIYSSGSGCKLNNFKKIAKHEEVFQIATNMNWCVSILFILRTVLVRATLFKWPLHLCRESLVDEVKNLTESLNKDVEIENKPLVLV